MPDKLKPEQAALLVSVLSIIISSGLDTDEIAKIATYLSTISSILFLIADEKEHNDKPVITLPSSAIRIIEPEQIQADIDCHKKNRPINGLSEEPSP